MGKKPEWAMLYPPGMRGLAAAVKVGESNGRVQVIFYGERNIEADYSVSEWLDGAAEYKRLRDAGRA